MHLNVYLLAHLLILYRENHNGFLFPEVLRDPLPELLDEIDEQKEELLDPRDLEALRFFLVVYFGTPRVYAWWYLFSLG